MTRAKSELKVPASDVLEFEAIKTKRSKSWRGLKLIIFVIALVASSLIISPKNKFFGSGKNIVNTFDLHIKDNFLEMTYKFKTQFKNFDFNVNVKDQMYVINENTLINYTKITKFLIPIAETQLLYKKL